ncbi:MAG: hypothetical protein FWD21_00330 [Peptococcaceae bacterium]|nr:hypothetical protein [Peptococcaceae bacterium]
MPLKECPNRHMYNADKYKDTCPICGATSKKPGEENKTKEEIAAMIELPYSRYVCGWLAGMC